MGEKLPMILSPQLDQDGPSSIGLLQGSERTSGTQYNSSNYLAALIIIVEFVYGFNCVV